MQDASTLATAHYPETLDRIFVSTSSRDSRLALLMGLSQSHSLGAEGLKIILADNRGSLILPNRLGLDQEMV